ncbi:MAG: hypothetical protein ACI8T1_000207 [Verrucomicrobiales bacterium]|jgi:hypothetical protein
MGNTYEPGVKSIDSHEPKSFDLSSPTVRGALPFSIAGLISN